MELANIDASMRLATLMAIAMSLGYCTTLQEHWSSGHTIIGGSIADNEFSTWMLIIFSSPGKVM